jgi:hypothetical protein
MNEQQSKEVLERFQAGTDSPQENQQVRYWLHHLHEDQPSDLSETFLRDTHDEMWSSILLQTQPTTTVKTTRLPLRIVLAAASVVAILGICIYFFTKEPSDNRFANNILPGTDKATLILSNGDKISLNEAKNGVLALQSTMKVIKSEGGEIIYTSRPDPAPYTNGARNQESETKNVNTMITPRGGQYKLSLPDGTKVWLNAASTLTYPVSFAGRKERRIELKGEAYFEVAKDKMHPFLVQSKTQVVKVLGTHFNISSYPDDASTQTTLVEGSVLVNMVALKPGQQAVNSGSLIKVRSVDPDGVIAWKNGEFSFRNEPLERIMKQLSRWYDVDVVYQNQQAGSQLFGGTISKYKDISKVLRMLELTGDVKFKMEGRKVFVQ